MALIDCFTMTSDVNNVDALIDLPIEMYMNMKCVELGLIYFKASLHLCSWCFSCAIAFIL